jgi:hypothetical protein
MKLRITKTKMMVAILAVAVLSGAVYSFVMWNLKRSFQKTDPQAFQDLFEASLGQAATAREGIQPGPGAIQYYRDHPEELQRDKRYFETYGSALMIATSVQERKQSIEEWTASTQLEWIPPSNKTDAWGHPFCIRSSPHRIVVVSPGPTSGPLDCRTLDIAEADLSKMTSARLNVQPSGALVVVLPAQKQTGG